MADTQHTKELIDLLVGYKCSFRRVKGGQEYGASALQTLLGDKDVPQVTEMILRPHRSFDVPPSNVIQALLIAREDWAWIFKFIDARFIGLCNKSVEDGYASASPVDLCHNAVIGSMEACVFLIGKGKLTPEQEEQFFDFLITISSGNYSQVQEFDNGHSGRMANCSGKLVALATANRYFARLLTLDEKKMSAPGRQIASEFSIKRFASLPLQAKIAFCAPTLPDTRARKK